MTFEPSFKALKPANFDFYLLLIPSFDSSLFWKFWPLYLKKNNSKFFQRYPEKLHDMKLYGKFFIKNN